jgi:hypothetical protein
MTDPPAGERPPWVETERIKIAPDKEELRG